jgi:hypothetical protein
MPTNDPDATIVQFGKHAGKRLDELDLDYRYRLWLDPQFERCHWVRSSAVNASFNRSSLAQHPEFAALNEAYEDAHPWTPSLGSEKIWFGRTSKGRELSTLYHRKGWLRWLLHPDRQRCFWVRAHPLPSRWSQRSWFLSNLVLALQVPRRPV